MNDIIYLIRTIAIACGTIPILVPPFVLFFSTHHKRENSIGKGGFLQRLPIVIITLIGLVAIGVILWKPIPLHLSPVIQFTITWVGFTIYIPAICLYLWGLFSLGKHFGVSSVLGSHLQKGHRLINSGPYRYVRHPMYLGVIVAAAGALMLFQTWAMVFFLPMSFIIFIRAWQEDKLLAIVYKDEWEEYTEKVGKWWPRKPR